MNIFEYNISHRMSSLRILFAMDQPFSGGFFFIPFSTSCNASATEYTPTFLSDLNMNIFYQNVYMFQCLISE